GQMYCIASDTFSAMRMKRALDLSTSHVPVSGSVASGLPLVQLEPLAKSDSATSSQKSLAKQHGYCLTDYALLFMNRCSRSNCGKAIHSKGLSATVTVPPTNSTPATSLRVDFHAACVQCAVCGLSK